MIMNKIIRGGATLAMLAMLITGCNKDTDQTTTIDNGDGVEVTLTAGFPSTRIGYELGDNGKGLKLSWEEGDKLDVFINTVSSDNITTFNLKSGSISADGKTATFTGILPSKPEATDKIIALSAGNSDVPYFSYKYPYSRINLNTGFLENLPYIHLLSAEATYGDGNVTFNFQHRLAVLKLTFTFPNDVTSGTKVYNLGITATSGLYTTVAFDTENSFAIKTNFSDTASSLISTSSSITVDSNHQATVYFMTAPGTITNVKGTAIIDGVTYKSEAAITSSLTMVAGKVYSKSGITMVKELTVADSFADGSGTTADPYQIANAPQLRLFANKVNSGSNSICGKLTGDIDLGDGSVEWTPIGTDKNYFIGNFNGDNHTISGTMNVSQGTVGGIFGYISLGTIENIHFAGTINVSKVSSSGSASVGAIVARAGTSSTATIVRHCSNSANISSPAATTGGIVGYVNRGTITASTNTGNMSSSYTGEVSIGGIAGRIDTNTTIIGCINRGNLSSTTQDWTFAGGITGAALNDNDVASDDIVTRCCWSNWSDISGITDKIHIGGVSGKTICWTLYDCYYREVSGLNGYYNWSGTIGTCTTFNSDSPTAAQIEAMNAAWATYDSARKYRFNTTTGAIEANN